MINNGEVRAQGVVSISEEAMFDDELETNKDFPIEQAQNKTDGGAVSKGPNAPTQTEGAVIPKGPNAPAQKEGAVIPKGPNAPTQTEGAVIPKGPNAPAQTEGAVAPKGPNAAKIDNSESLPVLAITNKKTSTKTIDSPVVQDNDSIVDDLFSQMSDIERNTALLNLQLKREKLQNEIEAVQNQRKMAKEQEKQKAEELRLKQKEKEQEQERLKIKEQQKLRELDIEFEKIRQEKLLKAYKNQMLEEQQKWIAHDAIFYKNIANLRLEKKALSQKHQEDLEALQKTADEAYKAYQSKLESHNNEINSLNSQIDVLRNRLSSVEQELAESRANPFANNPNMVPGGEVIGGVESVLADGTSGVSVDGTNVAITAEPIHNALAKYYAVTEIRGQGGELIAKLINKNGLSFYVKKGTTLQTGHIISEITSTYVAADKNYKTDYIYFSAGGILPEEIDAFKVEKEKEEEKK